MQLIVQNKVGQLWKKLVKNQTRLRKIRLQNFNQLKECVKKSSNSSRHHNNNKAQNNNQIMRL